MHLLRILGVAHLSAHSFVSFTFVQNSQQNIQNPKVLFRAVEAEVIARVRHMGKLPKFVSRIADQYCYKN